MTTSLALEVRTFPARIADLGFSVCLPRDWVAHELPDEDADFSNPVAFVPLAVVTAPHSAMVFAFAARPAYDDGTLHDWARYLLEHNQLEPRAIGSHEVGGVSAIVGEAVQQSDMGPMRVRFAFLEDGKRLVNVTLSAPEMLADTVTKAWFAALDSFALAVPRGASAPPAATAPAEGVVAEPVPPPAGHASGLAAHALADDAATLDPEHPVNANLRDRGVGLTPNVVALHDAEQRATLAAGAVLARFDVPYGWHVIDDGRRTLIFDSANQVQINLNLIALDGRGDDAVLDAIEAEARASYPDPEFMRLRSGRIRALGMRNIHDGGEPLEQYHMLVPGHDGETMLRARVTAAPERSTQACNLAELILESVRFEPFSTA